MTTVAAIFEASYRRFAGRPALVDGPVTRTYRELGDRAHRFASGLRARGLQPGDRVALVAPNSPAYIEASHGIFTGGYVRVAPSDKLHPDEVRGIVADCAARALVVSPEWAGRLDGIDAELIVFGEDFEALLAAGSPEPPDAPPAPGDLCALLYTSGTTGLPKAAMLTHANWVAMMRNSMVELPVVDPEDVVLHVAPLSHFSGYVEPTYSARGACHLVHAAFEPAAVLDAIERDRVTTLPLVPTMLNLMLPDAEAGGRDLSSIRTIMYGGSGIAPDRLARAVRVFGDVFVQFFGLSETPMPLTALSQRDHRFDASGPPPQRLASAGRVNPFVELRIVGDDGTDLPAGEVGEIVVRGDTVMAGYWGKPELTAETIDAEGWAATGDLGRLDDDGHLYIVDRKRDMIVTGGYNVYPAEVENAIASLEAVQEVAVVGAPDEQWGEAVTAVVVPRPGMTVTEDEVVAACTERLAGYKKPRVVEFVDELPKTGSGKLMRRRVRDRYWAGQARRVG
ncbi:long-chain fatty acid--CoA ligase [Baekduia soli]|uniref:Long-chain fatty acid--CoA ligase n=1 Tax=Baekduia soli TaxID=496014 RepID=A0A5B8UBN3_9ACTN|nr:AMP-binding protein [Baekduia soli]QEC50417.1 long-chain fatty acid--CoA ligase [Baekduia soli]